MPIASRVILDLELDDITMGLEPSPKSLHGLSHRELGDATQTLSPPHGGHEPRPGKAARQNRRSPDYSKAKDELYVRAQKLGRLFVPFRRVGLASLHESGKARGGGSWPSSMPIPPRTRRGPSP